MSRQTIRYIAIYAAIMLLMLSQQLQAQSLKAVARADSTNLLIGSELGLEVELSYPAEVEPLWPAWQTSLGSFLVIEQGEIEKIEDENGLKMRQRLSLMSFDSGYQQIPIIPMAALQGADTLRATTQPIGIDVYTVAVDTANTFKPIVDPIDAPVVFREILPYLVGAFLLIAIAFGIWWYRKQQAKKALEGQVEHKPHILPQVIARHRLRELDQAKQWQQGNIKTYFTDLSNILREYLENRYRILALESTTDEILDFLRSTRFPQQETAKLQDFLETADLAKYAKHKPTPEACQAAFLYSQELVKQTQLSTWEELEIEWGIRAETSADTENTETA